MQLVDGPQRDVNVTLMSDGQIAIIVKWGCNSTDHIGDIVQRWGNHLIRLGEKDIKSWPSLFSSLSTSPLTGCEVRILPKGTLIEV